MLLELAQKWRTDKAFFYAPFYEDLLAGKQVRKVLEVGIGTPGAMANSIARAGWTDYRAGASLRMWRDYFPDAHIYGLDINQNAVAEAADPVGRILTCCADSTKEIPFPILFDLIVDDGSHEPKDQLRTFQNLYPLLAWDGVYVIEDVTEPLDLPCPAEMVSFSNEYGRASIYVVRN